MPFAAQLAQQKHVADVRQKLVAHNIVDNMDTSPLSPDGTPDGSSLLCRGTVSPSTVPAVPGLPLSVESPKDDGSLDEHLYALCCESDRVAMHERFQFAEQSATVEPQSAAVAPRVDPMGSQNPPPVSYFLAKMTGNRGDSQKHL